MRGRHILVVAIDGLRASALGAYGNTTFSTRALDLFAAECLLLDWCYAPSADLAGIYRGLWHSIHPARPNVALREAASLPRLLATAGYTTTLIHDAPELDAFAAVADFSQCMQLAKSYHQHTPVASAEEVGQTSLARLLAAACETIGQTGSGPPRLVWVHARGMYGPWDAPLSLRCSLLDEGDPPPIETANPPDVVLTDADDPDTIFRYACAYAAQVMVLDTCWRALMDAVDSAGGAEWLVMLVGVRGCPLGEHSRIGGVDPRLYGEMLHVPWLVRFPDGRARLARSDRLVSHEDLMPTLLEWIAGGSGGDLPKLDGMSILLLSATMRAQWRDELISVNDAGRAIRTAEWCLIQMLTPRDTTTPPSNELYVRPDDRWEANDVAKLCPDVIETLTHQLDAELKDFRV